MLHVETVLASTLDLLREIQSLPDLAEMPYDWLASPVCEAGVTLAGLEDIMAMKLSAAAKRGKERISNALRDFVKLV